MLYIFMVCHWADARGAIALTRSGPVHHCIYYINNLNIRIISTTYTYIL